MLKRRAEGSGERGRPNGLAPALLGLGPHELRTGATQPQLEETHKGAGAEWEGSEPQGAQPGPRHRRVFGCQATLVERHELHEHC